MRDRNTDREKKIAEIRETLEKATRGPWKWIDPGGIERKKLVGEWEIMNFGIGGGYDQVAGDEPDEEDAHLIANAPEWLGFLLDELDRLEREYAEERAAHNAHVTELCELEKKYAAFLEQWEVYQREREKILEEIQTGAEKLCGLEQERNMYKASSEVFYERLKKEAEQREKLVECLRFYDRLARGREINDGGRRARTLLAEIGVKVSEL